MARSGAVPIGGFPPLDQYPRFMKSGNRAANSVKELLQLPAEAQPDEVFACVVGCLTDVLDYQATTPSRIPGTTSRFQAAWLSRDGRRYEGKGSSDREAVLAAAAHLLAHSEDAAILRRYAEPELEGAATTLARRLQARAAAPRIAPSFRRVRRAGSAE